MVLPRLSILCIALDPFLLRLVRNAHPDADLRFATGPDRVLQELSRDPDVIIHVPSGRDASHLADHDLEARTIAIVDVTAASSLATVADQVLVRPVDIRRLRIAISCAAGRDVTLIERVRVGLSRLDLDWEPPVLFAWLRVLMAVFAALTLLWGPAPVRVVPALAIAAAIVHALWRLRAPWLHPPHLWGDVAVAATAAIVVDVHPTPLLGLLLLAAIGWGHAGGAGVMVALTVVSGVAALPALAGRLDPLSATAIIVLVLAGTMLGSLVSRVRLEQERRHRRALTDVHQALIDLRSHAQANPARLHATTLRRDIVEGAAGELGAQRVALLCGPREKWHEPLVHGAPRPIVPVDVDVPARVAALPDQVRPVEDRILRQLVGGGAEVLAAPLRLDGILLGALLVAHDEQLRGAPHRERVRTMGHVATEAAIALDNADLFSAVDALAVDGERHRIARDLHDGIVQSFVHVGLELDRLADRLADVDLGATLEVMRLRVVVDETVTNSRSVIRRLRNRDLDDGFHVAVLNLLAEHRGPGRLEIELEDNLDCEPPPELAADLLLLLQQAVANVREHAAATRVEVRVATKQDRLVLQIADNGAGFTERGMPSPGSLRGMGIRAMQERVDGLGGELHIGPGVRGGTVVEVVVPDFRPIILDAPRGVLQ